MAMLAGKEGNIDEKHRFMREGDHTLYCSNLLLMIVTRGKKVL